MFRSPEELYDYGRDPDGLENLIGEPEHAGTADRLRALLVAYMRSTGDSQLAPFEAWLAGLETGEPRVDPRWVPTLSSASRHE